MYIFPYKLYAIFMNTVNLDVYFSQQIISDRLKIVSMEYGNQIIWVWKFSFPFKPGNKTFLVCLTWWRHQMEHFPRYWPFVRGIHRWPVNSPHKGQWRGALMFSLICALNKRFSKQPWYWWLETSLQWKLPMIFTSLHIYPHVYQPIT